MLCLCLCIVDTPLFPVPSELIGREHEEVALALPSNGAVSVTRQDNCPRKKSEEQLDDSSSGRVQGVRKHRTAVRSTSNKYQLQVRGEEVEQEQENQGKPATNSSGAHSNGSLKVTAAGDVKRARRNSTGGLATTDGVGMNNTAALNLQSVTTGQAHRGYNPNNPGGGGGGGGLVVDGSHHQHGNNHHIISHHHHNSSQQGHHQLINNNNIHNNNNNNSINNQLNSQRAKHLIQNPLTAECPWFLQNPTISAAAAISSSNSNSCSVGSDPVCSIQQMPPTAPLRQHKRPAPQPGQFGQPSPQQQLHTTIPSILQQQQQQQHMANIQGSTQSNAVSSTKKIP